MDRVGLERRERYHAYGHHLYLYAHADGRCLLLDTRRRSLTDDLSWDRLARARGWLARSEWKLTTDKIKCEP